MRVTVCIATYRRAERLAALLSDLAAQTRVPDQVVVVDNDAYASARAVVLNCRSAGAPFALVYDIQPKRNIALTRNRTVELATGDWLAFIDDDERAPSSWLHQLLECARSTNADGVLAPVVPIVPRHAPRWIRKGRFYDFPRMSTGEAVPLNRMRFGNALLSARRVRSQPGPFDAAYGLSTGEDADLLIRMVDQGARVIWCDEAIVHEPIEASRLRLRWLLQRALSGGQEYARKLLAGRYGRVTRRLRLQLLVRAVGQLVLAGVLAACCLPLGRHHAAQWLTRAFANFGKLSVFWGWRYREYA